MKSPTPLVVSSSCELASIMGKDEDDDDEADKDGVGGMAGIEAK